MVKGLKILKQIFGVKKSPDTSPLSTINNLREMEEMLGKKQTFLEEQVQVQLSLARKHGLKNKRAALLALKRKKRFEGLLQQLDGTLSTLEMQRESLEQAKNNVTVLQAMKTAAQSLKIAQQHLNVDKVLDVMEEVAEQQEVAQEISTAISTPISPGFGGDVDEEELEKELEALEQEDLDKELLHIAPTNANASAASSNGRNSEPLEDAQGYSGGKAKTSGGRDPETGPKSDMDKELDELASWAAT